METIIRGLTYTFQGTAFDQFLGDGNADNIVTNHTGWSIASQIRTRIGNKLVADLPVNFPVPTNGVFSIVVDREFTAALPLKSEQYWWSIVATSPSGQDFEYVTPEAIDIHDHPTDPYGISDSPESVFSGITQIRITSEDELELVKNGVVYWIPLNRR